MFRWATGGSSEKFRGIDVLIDTLSIERFLISPEQCGIFPRIFPMKLWL